MANKDYRKPKPYYYALFRGTSAEIHIIFIFESFFSDSVQEFEIQHVYKYKIVFNDFCAAFVDARSTLVAAA